MVSFFLNYHLKIFVSDFFTFFLKKLDIFQMLNPVLDELCGNIEFCDDEDIDDEDINDEDEDGEIEHENGSQDETQPFQNVELTPKDEAAISRLMELGFTKEQATQCYFIANKDENLAAELLLG